MTLVSFITRSKKTATLIPSPAVAFPTVQKPELLEAHAA
ncbi:hypothetical protein CPter291_4117 [Collimonas pratensis]|uniref:Uncharacterized protein n=1 Tax=Collimonas pratensis TaxID=279113 RepID=A0ABN4MDN0_9BURK|nr:hypothetical protein CPter291_4117 [Collimonas pratensis]